MVGGRQLHASARSAAPAIAALIAATMMTRRTIPVKVDIAASSL
jgi:hypothetical protein